jgi:DNA polymerase-3 subunit delta'
MDNFWEGITGQQKLKDFFSTLLSNKVFPQSLILGGIEGSGKDYLATRTAGLYNHLALNKTPTEFRDVKHPFSAPYVKYIFALPRGVNEESFDDPYEKLPQAAIKNIKSEIEQKNSNPYYRMNIEGANEIKINSIRDIQKYLGHTTSLCAHRTIIISQAHLMNEYAQNSLLKILEEPPDNCTLMLCTHQPSALKDTIRSRCWELNTTPFSVEEIAAILHEKFQLNESEIAHIAPLSEGSITTALHLSEQDIVDLKSKTIVFLRFALGNKYDSAYSHLTAVVGKRDSLILLLFLRLVILWLADAQQFKYDRNNLYFHEHAETFEKFYSRYDIDAFKYYIDSIEKSITLLNNNNLNKNILSLNLIHLLASITNRNYTVH